MSLYSSLELNAVIAQMVPYCAFSLGQKMLEETVPSYEPLQIRRDNERIRDALACTIHSGSVPLAGIRDISSILENAEKGRTLAAADLVDVMHQISGIAGIVSYEKLLDIPHESLKDLTDSLTVHEAVRKKLASCINDYGEVLDSASPLLRSIRGSLRQADSSIATAVNRFLSSHSASVVDSIVTDRGGRAVILVKATEKNAFGGLVYGDSASGQASYIEPASLIEPNNRKQELLSAQKEEIIRILSECSEAVGEIAEEEKANLSTCAVLDCLFAKAQWGQKRDAIAADLCSEKKILLKKARHPLIDPKKVVANDYHLEKPYRMLLITGPNTGGKTVSLKVIGLFVLMTYCGMPVTAEEAVIPYFDAVYADIGDDQSVVSSLSSFSAHIEKLADTANHATGNSLALLDEIGSGTDPREGESIAIAILNELRERGTMSVATTHYGRLKAYGKRHSDILVASVQFDMEKLMPTYRYMEGMTGQSNAFEVAERYGLPKSIIKYARFLKDQAKSQEDELIDRLEKQMNETAREKEKLEIAIQQNEEMNQKLQKEKAQLEREKDEWKQKADRQAEQYIEQARREADEILEEMRRKQNVAKYHEVLAEAKKLDTEPAAEKPTALDSVNHEFQEGETVELRSTGQPARILKIKKKDIAIELNGREIHVRKDQIRISDRKIAADHEKPEIHFSSADMFSTVPLECNLIGLHVDEAMEKLDEYLDETRLHRMKTFRIIHGDGSGALRKAVHQRLSQDSDVESYRLGMPQEGGTGATVVVRKGNG